MLSSRQLGLTVAITITGLAFAYGFSIPLVYGFMVGLLTLIAFSLQTGTSWGALMRSMWEGVKHTKEVIWILGLVGILIPTWTASGTIPYMIDQGLAFIHPGYYLTFSFVLAAIISMILGTSSGTLSSVGIPLIGIGALLHIPLPMVAGALVSGAFVGDRTSPFSTANQLVAASTGVSVKQQFQAMLPTTIGALIICFALYVAIDVNGIWHANAHIQLEPQFVKGFAYSLWLIVPVLVLLSSILLRLRTRYGFLLSIGAAVVTGSILQHVNAAAWVQLMWSGYHPAAFPALQTKGLSSMLELMALIALAGAFNGILEAGRVLQPYMQKLLGATSGSMFAATVRTALFGFGLALVACTQTLPIMMTGRSLLPFWEERFPRSQLSRVVADTSLITSAMVPWNLLAIVCGTIVGVPVEQYVVFAPFLWALPVCTLVWSIRHGERRVQRAL